LHLIAHRLIAIDEESEKAKKQVRLIALDCSSLDCH